MVRLGYLGLSLALIQCLFLAAPARAMNIPCLRILSHFWRGTVDYSHSEYEAFRKRLDIESPVSTTSLAIRKKKLFALLASDYFSSPEELLAATDHFLGTPYNSLEAKISKGDVWVGDETELIEKVLSSANRPPTLVLSDRLPQNEAEYTKWLAEVLQGSYLLALNNNLHSLSTKPLASNGGGPLGERGYGAKLERLTDETTKNFNSYLARLERVLPGLKKFLPTPVPSNALWTQMRNAIYTPLNPWRLMRKYFLSDPPQTLPDMRNHYLVKWMRDNGMRLSMIIGFAYGGYSAAKVVDHYSPEEIWHILQERSIDRPADVRTENARLMIEVAKQEENYNASLKARIENAESELSLLRTKAQRAIDSGFPSTDDEQIIKLEHQIEDLRTHLTD